MRARPRTLLKKKMYQTSIRFNDKIPSYTFPNLCIYKPVKLYRSVKLFLFGTFITDFLF